MKMTQLEHSAKNQIIKKLNTQGYPTYARLLDLLDVKLINTEKNPDAIAYLATDKATIFLNPNLNIEQISTIVRHEILHEYLTHFARAEKIKASDPKYKNVPHDLVNIAADYEISNRGYTDDDKMTARGIELNGNFLKGLVTEDDHPDWVDLSFEEMLDKLIDEQENYQGRLSMPDMSPEQLQDLLDNISDEAEGAGGAGDEQDKDLGDQISQAANNLSDQVENTDKKSESDGPIRSQQSNDELEEEIEKAKRLKDALNRLKDRILDETEKKVTDERVAKQAKDAKKYTNSPLSRFTDSLNQFIKKEVATGRGPTWSKINKKYAGSGIIKAGSSRLASGKIPLINVYFDRSPSWDSSKTEKGAQAIATLNKYVVRNEIRIKLYYFSINVHSEEQEAKRENWTKGQPILDHIQATKPDNVIILTDDDIEDCRTDVSVPGAVWMLFYQGRSKNLMDHLHGKKLTKYFDIRV